jgi:hypothetical protein
MARKADDSTRDLIKQAQLRLQHPLDAEDALQKLGGTGTTPLAKRLAIATQTHPHRAKAFCELGAHLLTMAPGRPRSLQRAVMLYVPDGAYQMQVFAIDDAIDNTLVVCCEDVLSIAVANKLVAPEDDAHYRICGTRLTLSIEQFDGRSANPPAYINAMTGWNRKAIRITLPPDLTPQHVATTLMLCALSAGLWKTMPAKA